MTSFINKKIAFLFTVFKKTTKKIIKKVLLSLGLFKKHNDDSVLPVVVTPTVATESSRSTYSNESISNENDNGTSNRTTEEVKTVNATAWFEWKGIIPLHYKDIIEALILVLYEDNNYDDDEVEQMQSRFTSDIELYKYLKQQFWYKVYTSLLYQNNKNIDDEVEFQLKIIVDEYYALQKKLLS